MVHGLNYVNFIVMVNLLTKTKNEHEIETVLVSLAKIVRNSRSKVKVTQHNSYCSFTIIKRKKRKNIYRTSLFTKQLQNGIPKHAKPLQRKSPKTKIFLNTKGG